MMTRNVRSDRSRTRAKTQETIDSLRALSVKHEGVNELKSMEYRIIAEILDSEKRVIEAVKGE